MEILIQKDNVALDATLLSSIQSCARLSDFRFNHDLVSINGKSNSLECGSLVHHILESYYKSKRGGISSIIAIEEAFKVGALYIKGCQYCISEAQCPYNHGKDEFLGMKNTPEESTSKPRRTGWAWVLETINQYFDFYKNDSWVPIDIEYVKGKVIYEDDDIRILWKAKYDLIVDTNNGFFPIDHKSESMAKDSVLLNNQFMGQCLLLNQRAMIVNKIGFQTSMKPVEKFRRVVMNYTLDQLTEWSQEIVPFWAKMLVTYGKNNIWPANFMRCETKFGVCDFYDVCSVDRSIRAQTLKMNFVKGRKWDINND